MKNTIKKAIYGATSTALLLPMVALAQFNPGNANNPGISQLSLGEVLNTIMLWLLGLVGILGVIGFAISGIMYLTSAGDDDRMGTAKKAMVYSIIGIVVALLGLVALNTISSVIGGDVTGGGF
jgi:hypothetical protein